MNKEFIPYEQALDLKELGFDEPCFGYYVIDGKELIVEKWMQHPNKSTWTINAPTFSQAFRWLREKHKLHNGIYPYYDGYEFQIKDFRLPTSAPINGRLMPYEEAELACLKELIEIVKEK